MQQAEPSESPPPTRRRPSPPASEASLGDEDLSEAGEENGTTQAHTSQEQMVKKLVRLALASEYSRRPIKREDITKKGKSDIYPPPCSLHYRTHRTSKVHPCNARKTRENPRGLKHSNDHSNGTPHRPTIPTRLRRRQRPPHPHLRHDPHRTPGPRKSHRLPKARRSTLSRQQSNLLRPPQRRPFHPHRRRFNRHPDKLKTIHPDLHPPCPLPHSRHPPPRPDPLHRSRSRIRGPHHLRARPHLSLTRTKPT